MIQRAILFIHGFWSSAETWDRLAEALRMDKRLASFDMRRFSYDTKGLPRSLGSRIPDFDDIAQTLAEYVRLELGEFDEIAIVAHSQGGLITQRYLAWMTTNGRARQLARIKVVILLACPNEGSEYWRLFRALLRFNRKPQSQELAVLNKDVGDTRRRVLASIINTDTLDDHHCPIPFRVYAGASDKVVTRTSAQSAFEGATSIPGDHRSILDPTVRGSLTVKAIAEDVLTYLGDGAPTPGVTSVSEGSDPRHDVAAAASAQGSVRVRSRPPSVVPVELQDRTDDLDRLRKALNATNDRVVSLIGPVGAGKTALVSRLFLDLERAHNPPFRALDYLAARGHMTVTGATVLERIVRLMPDGEEKIQLCEDLVSRHASWIDRAEDVLEATTDDVLLIIDQAEDLLDADGRCLDRGLGRLIGGLAARRDHHVTVLLVSAVEPDGLIIGRRRSAYVHLDQRLEYNFADALLTDLIEDSKVTLSPRIARDSLLALADGHPRTLEVALAACLLDPSLATVHFAALSDLPHEERLSRLNRKILEALNPDDRRVVCALAVLGLPVPTGAVQQVLRGLIDRKTVAAQLARFSMARFVRIDGRNFYVPRALEIVEECTELDPGGPGAVNDLRKRAADYFAGEKYQQNVGRVEDLGAHFREIALRLQLGEEVGALELMGDLQNSYLERWGYSYVLLPWREQLRERFRGEQWGRSNLASMASSFRDIDEHGAALACLEEALTDSENEPDAVRAKERPTLLTQMASTAWSDWRISAARELYSQVLDEPPGPDDRKGEAHLGLCQCYAELGDFGQAQDHQRMAFDIAIRSKDGGGPLRAQTVLAGGIIQRALGNYDTAVPMLEEAATIAGSAQGRVRARSFDALAGALLESGDTEQARDRAEDAVRVAAQNGVIDVVRGANSTLALVHLAEGNFSDARRAAMAAVRFFRSPRALSAQLTLGIAVYRSGTDSSEAKAALLAALETCRELLRREPRAYVVLDAMGLALTGLSLLGEREAFEEAVATYKQARDVTDARGVRRRVGVYLSALTADVNPSAIAAISSVAMEPVGRRSR